MNRVFQGDLDTIIGKALSVLSCKRLWKALSPVVASLW
jgi:hypothetical protein